MLVTRASNKCSNVVDLRARMLSVLLLSPLVDGRVNNVLLQTAPNVNETQLQVIDTVHKTFIHYLLHNTPDFIIH